ncbi:uncharacterized protein BKA78DRAFT_107022 [Phyllosticta capitalensis]|uniref:uncharacterized protein n=1 Tax=Phyllosticta capitalensis TaxID=121624 RepID=UPI0031314F5B
MPGERRSHHGEMRWPAGPNAELSVHLVHAVAVLRICPRSRVVSPVHFGDRFPMDTVCGTMAVVRYVIRHLGRFLSTWIIRCPRAFPAGEEEKKRVGREGRRVFIHGVAARLALPDGQARLLFHRDNMKTSRHGTARLFSPSDYGATTNHDV